MHDRRKRADRAPARETPGEADARLILPDQRASLFPASFAPGAPQDPCAPRTYADETTIGASAAAVRRSIERREAAGASGATAVVRLFIAAVWLTAGLYYFRSSGSGAMDADHAARLSTAFFTLGGAGFAAAAALMGLVALRARGLDAALAETSRRFGEDVADRLADYDQRLSSAVEAAGLSAVADAERAARAAGELSADLGSFLQLSCADRGRANAAIRAYDGFLRATTADRKEAPRMPNAGRMLSGAVFALSATGLVAALAAVVSGVSLTFGDAAASGAGLANQPGPGAVVLLGAIAFLAAGAAPGIRAGARATDGGRAPIERSLAAFRAGAQGRSEVPAVSDVARRADAARRALEARLRPDGVEDAASPNAPAFKAPGGTPVTGPARTGGGDEDDGSEPYWRRRKEGRRFVPTGFEAAPQPWRTDAYAARFAAEETRAPEAKRGFSRARKPFLR